MIMNKRAFTLIELVLSFALSMFIILGLYSLSVNYREKVSEVDARKGMLEFKSNIEMAINEDIIDRGLSSVSACLDSDSNVINRCVRIVFKDNSAKELKVVIIPKEEEVSGSKFLYDTVNVIYGKELFESPFAKYVSIVDDYMYINSNLSARDPSYNLFDINKDGKVNNLDSNIFNACFNKEDSCTDKYKEASDFNSDNLINVIDKKMLNAYLGGSSSDSSTIYTIKMRFKHQNIKDEFVVKVVGVAY